MDALSGRNALNNIYSLMFPFQDTGHRSQAVSWPVPVLWAGELQTPSLALQVDSKLPHGIFLSWEHGSAVPAVTLAVGAEAGEISNVEKLQLSCWPCLTA